MAYSDNLKKGVTIAIAAALCLALMNMVAKILTDQLHPVIITFWRNIIAFGFIVGYLMITRQYNLFKTGRLKGHILRGVIGTTGMVCSVFAFKYLPLTQATLIGFSSPLFVVFLSYPLLKEKVGPFRIVATLVGFLGVVMVIGFDYQAMNITGVLFALMLAIMNAIVLICLRWLGGTENMLTTNFYFMGIGCLLCGLYVPFAETLLPDPSLYWAIGTIGVIGLFSLLFKTESYRHAPANVIAPLSYTMLIWVAILDYAVWGIISPYNMWIGAFIIIASNLFILWRERLKQKQ